MSESVLTSARDGKDLVCVFRVVRGIEFHQVVEYNVTVLLEGDIETSYTVADNSVVVTTDSIKNITYYLAEISPHILSPEQFTLHLGPYLVSMYAHIHHAFVSLEKLRWSRITLSGNVDPHPHSFVRDGNDKGRGTNVNLNSSHASRIRVECSSLRWSVPLPSAVELRKTRHRLISPVASPHGGVIAYDPEKYLPTSTFNRTLIICH